MAQHPEIRFIRRHPEAQLPAYGSSEAAGADVRSVEDLTLAPGRRILVPTGLGCVIPSGWEIQARPRSGLALKHGITLVNSPGTIDSDFGGEIGIILINHGTEPFQIRKGDRIAQIVVAPAHRASFGWAETGRETARGTGGFGSTGVS